MKLPGLSGPARSLSVLSRFSSRSPSARLSPVGPERSEGRARRPDGHSPLGGQLKAHSPCVQTRDPGQRGPEPARGGSPGRASQGGARAGRWGPGLRTSRILSCVNWGARGGDSGHAGPRGAPSLAGHKCLVAAAESASSHVTDCPSQIPCTCFPGVSLLPVPPRSRSPCTAPVPSSTGVDTRVRPGNRGGGTRQARPPPVSCVP